MNLRLWFRLFLNQLVIGILLVSLIVSLIVFSFDLIPLADLLMMRIYNLPFFLILLALIISTAAILYSYFAK